MLSSETAVGRHPASAVAIMDRIVKAVEADADYTRSTSGFAPDSSKPHVDTDIVADAVDRMAELNGCAFIFVSTSHISALSRFSRARPQRRMITHAQDSTKLAHQSLFWGVEPLPVAGELSHADLIAAIRKELGGRKCKVACALGDPDTAESPGWRLEVIDV